MKIFKNSKPYTPDKTYLHQFINDYWFAPQDVLLRSVEANIWGLSKFTPPVLDIGIGNGSSSLYMFQGKEKIDVGIDYDKQGLSMALATGRYKKTIHASAEDMPFKNNSFKTVVSNSTFEHITHDFKALAEVSRVLKKNGYFFLTVPSEYLPKYILSIEGNNNKGQLALEKFNNRVAHFHYHSLSTWEKELKKNKMKIVFYEYYYPLSTTKIWYRLMKFSTKKLRNKEIWSYLAHSRVRKVIPENIAKLLLKNIILKKAYTQGFFTPEHSDGAMLFFIAQKLDK